MAAGAAGLVDRNRRSLNPSGRRALADEDQHIFALRSDRKLGIKRLRNELIRLHGLRLSVETIHKVPCHHRLRQLRRPRLVPKGRVRSSRPIPGDGGQMDFRKIGPRLYQYTAIDDCLRYQVVALFPSRSTKSTLAFLDELAEGVPLSIQRIQADRGHEIFAYKMQDRLRSWSINFRPIRPRSPHINGKVERMQETALEEFCSTVDRNDPEHYTRLVGSQHFYKWKRPRDSLGGLPRIDRQHASAT